MSKFNNNLVKHSRIITLVIILFSILLHYFVYQYIYSHYHFIGLPLLAVRLRYTWIVILFLTLVIGPSILKRFYPTYKDVLFPLYCTISTLVFLTYLFTHIVLPPNFTGVDMPNKISVAIVMSIWMGWLIYFITIQSIELFKKGELVLKESMGLIFLYFFITIIAFTTSLTDIVDSLFYLVINGVVVYFLFFKEETKYLYYIVIGYVIGFQLYAIAIVFTNEETRSLWFVNLIRADLISQVFLVLSSLLIIKKRFSLKA